MTTETKLKRCCMAQYYDVYYHGGSTEKAIDRCYGAIMFAINNLFDDFNDDIAKWWDDEMLPRFRELDERR